MICDETEDEESPSQLVINSDDIAACLEETLFMHDLRSHQFF